MPGRISLCLRGRALSRSGAAARTIKAEPTDNAEPIDRIDPAEPILPIEATDPMRPMHSTEPRDPINSSESVDHSDKREGPVVISHHSGNPPQNARLRGGRARGPRCRAPRIEADGAHYQAVCACWPLGPDGRPHDASMLMSVHSSAGSMIWMVAVRTRAKASPSSDAACRTPLRAKRSDGSSSRSARSLGAAMARARPGIQQRGMS